MKVDQESKNTLWENHLTALANPYRRQLLISLLTQNPRDDGDIDPLNAIVPSETKAETIRTELVHSHLPRLADMGYINWDRHRDKLSKGPNWGEIAPLLRLIHEHRDELSDGWL